MKTGDDAVHLSQHARRSHRVGERNTEQQTTLDLPSGFWFTAHVPGVSPVR